MKPSKIGLLKNLALAAVSTTIFLFGIELVLRVTQIVPARTLEYVTPAMWNEIPGPLWPGQGFTDRFKRSLPYTISVNELGFRGPEAHAEKSPGTIRVLCLGDSYTFGAYVDDTETWPVQLERALDGRLPGQPVEAINTGISGFTIVDELAFLKEHGLDLDPDIVVLAFVLNDLADLTRGTSSREVLRLSIEENYASLFGPLKKALRQTATYNGLFLLKAGIRKMRGNDPTLQQVDIRHLLDPDFDAQTLELFDLYESHLLEMKRVLDENSIHLVLMIFPYWEQIARGATDATQNRLKAMADSLGIPVVDLLPVYRRLDPEGKGFFHMPVDHHPSASGYSAAADVLATRLVPLTLERPEPADTARSRELAR